MAVGDEGVTYCVPPDTQPGDVICEIGTRNRTNSLGLLRTANGDTFIAGRAIHFFAGSQSDLIKGRIGSDIEGKLPDNVQLSTLSSFQLQIIPTFVVDPYAAQLLTRPSFYKVVLP